MKEYLKWIILIVLTLTWGSSFFLIKKGLVAFSPYQVGALRIVMAAISLLIIGGKQLPKIPTHSYKWVFLAGLLGSFFPLFLFPLAEEEVDSGIAGVLNALVPLFTLILGVIFFKNKSSKRQFLGVFLGLIGTILLIFLPTLFNDQASFLGKEVSIPHALLIVLATFMYAINALVIKHKLSHINPITLTTGLFSSIAILGLIVLIYTGFFSTFDFSPKQVTSLGYISILAIAGTAIAMLLFNKLMQHSSAVFVSSVTYLMPIVALLWGILDGEQITLFHIGCFGIIIIGVLMINRSK
ncbi:putative transporter YdfC [Flavobacteriaceae bacterium UJ101]|nr:putative transporter YdfC [Flavobacteriaceae bacterium UJ101]